MATTTSVQDSGLLDNLLPPFEQKFNVKVDVIAVGTGKALKLAENGDVDIVFVHDPESEEKFVQDGFGINRQEVMFNDFVIIGPRNNPADIRGHDAASAFRKIAEKKCFFVSRGDESGTHKKEKQLWKKANIDPQGEWYLEAGQGMGATLLIASEKRAYCLADRATYNAYINKVELIILSFSDLNLINRYSVIAVNPKRNPHLNYNHALALIKWLISPQAQKIIAMFKKDGKILFHPAVYTGD
ncbi:MAG: substrate-binding domain-containing protein [Candidatus Omnitrophota bacterium]